MTASHKASATAMFEYWKRARNAAHAACDDLAKGDQNPDVLKAVKQLSETLSAAETSLKALQERHRTWSDGIRELRGWYKQDTEAVRQLFCNLPDSPGDDAEVAALVTQVNQTADRMRDRIKPRWGTIGNEAATMIASADALIRQKDPDVFRGASAVREKVTKTMSSLQNLLDNELYGANDPEVRAMLETGKNEHKRIQADSSKCEVSEVSIPGESMRIDCVRVTGGSCNIVEIKPNNAQAFAKARKQLADYANAISSLYFRNKGKVDDVFTGKLAIFKRCIGDGKIELSTDIRAYDYCPPDGKLHNDFIVSE